MKLLWPLLLIAGSAFGFSKDFTLINDRSPLEFKILFDTMKNTLKEPEDEARLVAYCQRINKGLGPLKKDQAFFLLKSEIYKTLLEWKFPPSTFQLSELTLGRLKANLQGSSAIYTPFSQWFIEALIADLEIYQRQGLLSMNATARGRLTGEARASAVKFERVLKYTKGWVEQADSLSAQDFNALTRSASWHILRRIREKAQLFQGLSSQAVEATEEMTFNIPEGKNDAPPTPVVPAAKGEVQDLSQQGQKVMDQTQKAMEKVDVKPSDIPASELSKEIDKIDTKAPSESDGSGAQSGLQ